MSRRVRSFVARRRSVTGCLVAIVCLGLAGGDAAVVEPARTPVPSVGPVSENPHPPAPTTAPDRSTPTLTLRSNPVVVEPDPDPNGPCDGPSDGDEPWIPAVVPPAVGENRGESHDLFLRDDQEICIVLLAARLR
ncbi:MAG: hypothetical protein RIB98_01270 [Acidimicrobiales bacterium]